MKDRIVQLMLKYEIPVEDLYGYSKVDDHGNLIAKINALLQRYNISVKELERFILLNKPQAEVLLKRSPKPKQTPKPKQAESIVSAETEFLKHFLKHLEDRRSEADLEKAR